MSSLLVLGDANVATVGASPTVTFPNATALAILGAAAAEDGPAVMRSSAIIRRPAAGHQQIVLNETIWPGSVTGLVRNVSGAAGGPPDEMTSAHPPVARALADCPRVACFAAGTWITTTRGHVAVEFVHPGDHIRTLLGGEQAAVIWVGRRIVNCTRHPEPTKVWPVRVAADTFGRGMPATDLFLSPNHAVFVDRVLIPVRLLVNGRSVRQVMTDRISYHHIELARHDVLLANGMPAESYLDTGDRARFSNGGDVITLHPDLSATSRPIHGCAPLVQVGRVLDAVRNRLASGGRRRKRHLHEMFEAGTTWPGPLPGPADPWPN